MNRSSVRVRFSAPITKPRGSRGFFRSWRPTLSKFSRGESRSCRPKFQIALAEHGLPKLPGGFLKHIGRDMAAGICRQSDATMVAELRRRAETGEQKAALAREFGVTRATFYKYLESSSKRLEA